MIRVLVILAALVGLAVLLVIYLPQIDEPRSRDYAQQVVVEAQPVTITMLSSDEKEEWIRKAASDFSRLRPDINLDVQAMSSVEGLEAILSRQVTPTLWSPAVSSMLNRILYRWQQEFGENLFALDGEDAPRQLALSPAVWLTWKSRVEAINAAIAAGSLKDETVWPQIGCAGVPREPEAEWPGTPARWDKVLALPPAAAAAAPAPAGQVAVRPMAPPSPITTWGEIKFFHTDPTVSQTGFFAIYLMAYQFMDQPERVTKTMLDKDPFLTWFRRCQRLRRGFADSVQTLTNRPLQFGPTNYDIVVTYENLALRSLYNSNNRWSEQPYLYYPKTTMWADHPIVILNSKGLQRDQREAARDWIAFLLAPERQRSLVSFGLRPVSPDVSLRDRHADNPFTKAGRFNAQLELKFEQPPAISGAAIATLLEIWAKATGYY